MAQMSINNSWGFVTFNNGSVLKTVNVTSVTKVSTGLFTVVFPARPSASYFVGLQTIRTATSGQYLNAVGIRTATRSTTQFQVDTRNITTAGTSSTALDPNVVNVTIIDAS